ncbi:putative beta-1,3-galactosyltransferase 2 [Camellia lanceoleosa]|uniref:Beta-1,3-galactosyltransferase 2 n=1 Tax=Camellia lanceoleosa TaxID=1840588 RepID=A0ACC0GHG5_9ERIC|nr:putative beta-1,3-galactosyltransferase 2 [Camellia lanceoleosa]
MCSYFKLCVFLGFHQKLVSNEVLKAHHPKRTQDESAAVKTRNIYLPRASPKDSLRETWMPQGEKRRKLEEETGIVIRFVIGHSSTSDGILDKAIEAEDRKHKDFLLLGLDDECNGRDQRQGGSNEDGALKFSAGNDQISVNGEKRVWRQKTVLSSNSNKSNKSSSTINHCVKRNGFYGGAVLNLVQMKPFNLRSVLGPQHKYGRVHSLFWRPKSTTVDLGVSIGKNKNVQVPYEPSSLFSIGPKGIVEGVDVVEKSSISIVSSNSVKIEESSRRHEGGGVHKASYPNNASQRNKEMKKKFLKASLVLPKFKRWGIGFR